MRDELSNKKLDKRTKLSAYIILLLIPLTIYFGIAYLGDRKYYLISLAIIAYTIIPFLFVFESRKPKAREIVVIAVMSAIAVAGRAAFFMLPQFKPVVAIVIISGVCLGAEAGFLVGAMSGFVSNFLFGQGPLTPWQMFCFGIIGFLAGILFEKGILKKTKLGLCIFGGLSTFFIYGGIINIGALITFSGTFSIKRLIPIYISGFWFDIIHSSATVIFLYFISESMIEKIDRIKIKYGLLK